MKLQTCLLLMALAMNYLAQDDLSWIADGKIVEKKEDKQKEPKIEVEKIDDDKMYVEEKRERRREVEKPKERRREVEQPREDRKYGNERREEDRRSQEDDISQIYGIFDTLKINPFSIKNLTGDNNRDSDNRKRENNVQVKHDRDNDKNNNNDNLSLNNIFKHISKTTGTNVMDKNWQYVLTDLDNDGKKEMNFFYTNDKKTNFDPLNWEKEFEKVKQIPVWKNPILFDKLNEELGVLDFNSGLERKKQDEHRDNRDRFDWGKILGGNVDKKQVGGFKIGDLLK